VRVRVGFNQSVHEGPALSSIHEGTDTLLFQQFSSISNNFRFGVDYKGLPKTNISYDQFVTWYKGDTTWQDFALSGMVAPLFQLSNGTPVDLGLPFNTAASQPCATPVSNAGTTPPTANATCNGFLAYSRVGAPRVSIPTEQLSFQTSYFHDLEWVGRFSYSSSDGSVRGFDELFAGLSRNRQAAFETSGPVDTRRVAVNLDTSAVWSATSKLKFIDSFRFSNWRIPGLFDFSDPATNFNLFSASMLIAPNPFNPATCPAPFTAAACPQHVSGSAADHVTGFTSGFLQQDAKYNTIEADLNLNKRFGTRLGFIYAHRKIAMNRFTMFVNEEFDPGPTAALAARGPCALVAGALPAGCTGTIVGGVPTGPIFYTAVDSTGDPTTEPDSVFINEYSGLFGLWMRPWDPVRVSFDLVAGTADNVYTRISPRQHQQYKLRSQYKPRKWLDLGMTLNIYEARNNTIGVEYLAHNRSYDFSGSVIPNSKFSLTAGFNYNDFYSHTDICYSGTPVSPPGAFTCPAGGGTISGVSIYKSFSKLGYFDLLWTPIHHLTAGLGYTVTSVTGSALILNPNTPPGPLDYDYHKPHAQLIWDMTKNIAWRAAWGYYGYGEFNQSIVSGVDPTGNRSFHANIVDLALRYSF
jgi:hypothetical protein